MNLSESLERMTLETTHRVDAGFDIGDNGDDLNLESQMMHDPRDILPVHACCYCGIHNSACVVKCAACDKCT